MTFDFKLIPIYTYTHNLKSNIKKDSLMAMFVEFYDH